MRALPLAVAFTALIAACVAFIAVGHEGAATCEGATHTAVYAWTAAAGLLSAVAALALAWRLTLFPRIAVSLVVGVGSWIAAWAVLVVSAITYCAE